MDQFASYFVFEISLAALAAVLSLLFPNWLALRLELLVQSWRRIGANHKRGMWLSFGAPILLQLLFTPIYPPPQQGVADEFSHLLVADTLLHGRLANPQHPLWRHFETFYVIFDPSYASIYPVGPGTALALPQLVGLPPYVGLWIAAGLLSAATYWMLLAWFPPHWALMGSLVVLPRITFFSYWVHTYWGGSVAAIGGTLAIGAVGHMMNKPFPKFSWIFGAGVFIALNSRPYEGAVLAMVLACAVISILWKSRQFRTNLPPLIIMGAITVGFIMLHNYRVTGSATKLPYQRNRELYGTPQGFFWQPTVPPVPTSHSVIRQVYEWQFEAHEKVKFREDWLKIVRERGFELWQFFPGSVWVPVLVLIPWFSRRYRVPILALSIVLIATVFYPFFFSHYYAPVASVFVLIVLAGLFRARTLTFRDRPVGAALSLSLILCCALANLSYAATDIYAHQFIHQPKNARTQLLEALNQMGGRHVVLVRYRPEHIFHREVVYNNADIDASPVVWARDMGPLANIEVIRYYAARGGRRIWLYEPDEQPARLSPYRDPTGGLLAQ